MKLTNDKIIFIKIFLMCKKILFLIIISILTFGCATTDSLISEGKVYSGMSKTSLRNLLLDVYPNEDPFIYGSFSEFDYSNNIEIISGSNRNVFYVFKDVKTPVKCGLIICKYGDGKLLSWHYSINSARTALTDNNKFEDSQQPKISKVSSSNNQDHVDALNKLIEDFQSGKISQTEFNKKKSEILN